MFRLSNFYFSVFLSLILSSILHSVVETFLFFCYCIFWFKISLWFFFIFSISLLHVLLIIWGFIFFSFVSSMFVITHWKICIMTVLKPWSENSNISVTLVLASTDCLYLLSAVGGNWENATTGWPQAGPGQWEAPHPSPPPPPPPPPSLECMLCPPFPPWELFSRSQPWERVLFFFLNKFIYFIYLCLAALGPCCCAWAFSSCSERGPLFVAVCEPLFPVASPVAEHGL